MKPIDRNVRSVVDELVVKLIDRNVRASVVDELAVKLIDRSR